MVPKKSGVTVVTNQDGESVPTREQTRRGAFAFQPGNLILWPDPFPQTFIDQMLERLASWLGVDMYLVPWWDNHNGNSRPDLHWRIKPILTSQSNHLIWSNQHLDSPHRTSDSWHYASPRSEPDKLIITYRIRTRKSWDHVLVAHAVEQV